MFIVHWSVVIKKEEAREKKGNVAYRPNEIHIAISNIHTKNPLR